MFKMTSFSRNKSHKRSSVDKLSYNERTDKYREIPDFVYSSTRNLPIQFKNPKDFWQSVEDYERKNGQLYYYIEANLPQNLDKSGYIKIVNDFIDKSFSDKTVVSYAIHNKKQLDGTMHPHVHMMFSARQFENNQNLTKKELFKKENSPKYDGYSKKKFLYFMRENFEYSSNRELEKNKLIQDMKKENYRELRNKAIGDNNWELARIYYQLDFYRKKHNDTNWYDFSKKRRELEKLARKEDRVPTLEEIRNLNFKDYKSQKRANLRDKESEHLERLQKDKQLKDSFSKKLNISDTDKVIVDMIKEANRLYRTIDKFELIEDEKTSGFISEILNEESKNYSLELPNFITDGEIMINKDVIAVKNYKQLKKAVRQNSLQLESTDAVYKFSKDYSQISDSEFQGVFKNPDTRNALEKFRKRTLFTEHLEEELIENAIEMHRRYEKTLNNTDIMDMKLRGRKILKIHTEINSRNKANAYVIHKILDYDDKISASAKNQDTVDNRFDVAYMISRYKNGAFDNFIRDFYEQKQNIEKNSSLKFDIIQKEALKNVTVKGIFNPKQAAPLIQNREELTETYNKLKKKIDTYESYINKEKKEHEKPVEEPKKRGLFGLFFSNNEKETTDTDKKPEKPTELEYSVLRNIEMQIFNEQSELKKRENERLRELKKKYDKDLEMLKNMDKYENIILEFTEYIAGLNERRNLHSGFHEKKMELEEEINKFRIIEKTDKQDVFPF